MLWSHPLHLGSSYRSGGLIQFTIFSSGSSILHTHMPSLAFSSFLSYSTRRGSLLCRIHLSSARQYKYNIVTSEPRWH